MPVEDRKEKVCPKAIHIQNDSAWILSDMDDHIRIFQDACVECRFLGPDPGLTGWTLRR